MSAQEQPQHPLTGRGTARLLDLAVREVEQPTALFRQSRLTLAYDERCEGWVLHITEPQFTAVRARGLVGA